MILILGNGLPGVGQYQNTEPISTVGKYNNSKYKGGTIAKFMKTPRATFFDNATRRASQEKPGPGSYQQPSEFGQYDGNVYSWWSYKYFLNHRLSDIY